MGLLPFWGECCLFGGRVGSKESKRRRGGRLSCHSYGFGWSFVSFGWMAMAFARIVFRTGKERSLLLVASKVNLVVAGLGIRIQVC